MKISELRSGQSRVEIEATVKEIEEPRAFNKFGRDITVANALDMDESGSIKLSLWNSDIEKVKVGDKIKISNGFVNEFKGEKQLTAGKFGKMEVLGAGENGGEKVESEETESEEAEIVSEAKAAEEAEEISDEEAM